MRSLSTKSVCYLVALIRYVSSVNLTYQYLCYSSTVLGKVAVYIISFRPQRCLDEPVPVANTMISDQHPSSIGQILRSHAVLVETGCVDEGQQPLTYVVRCNLDYWDQYTYRTSSMISKLHLEMSWK